MDLVSVLNKLNHSAEWMSLRYVEMDERTVYVRDERLEGNVQELDRGVMVEVLVNGQFGYSATNDLTQAGIQQATKRAEALANISAPYKIHHFNKNLRPKATGEYKSSVARELDFTALESLAKDLIDATKQMKTSEEIISRNAFAIHSIHSTHFVSTQGSDFSQKIYQNNFNLQATGQRGSDIQKRSDGMRVSQSGIEFLSRENILSTAEKVGREVVELLDAENCPSGEMDLLLTPSQLYLQIHESIGHPLEIDRILGDERNFAGWSFVNVEDFGQLRYGSDLLNVTFDPTIPHELASYQFDETGHRATKEYIIKDGILLRGLGGLESQARSNLKGVACARASSWNRAPVDRMANLNIEPGTSSLDEMIQSVRRGVLMETNRSWSIDDYRDKFQFGCEFGKLIEDGKVVKTVKNPNYRGQCTPFWNSLKAVGNHDTMEVWGSFYCGKAEPNQIIRVGHASPHCLFENIDVFGGVQ